MKLTEEQIENIRNQSYRTQELMETLCMEFTELAESLGLKEDTQCPKMESALNWLHDAVYNFPPISLYNAEEFKKCIEVIGERLEQIEYAKHKQQDE